ncbi:hypothetical protein CHE218_32450 [Microbacterium sp. che218]
MRHAQNSVAPREGCGAVFSVDLLHAYCKHCDGYPPAELALKAAQSQRPRQGAPRARPARQLRPSEIDEVVAWYREVGNIADMARRFRITRQPVGAHLASRRIETVRRMSETDISTAAAMYGEGRSAATIGRRLGFDAQTLATLPCPRWHEGPSTQRGPQIAKLLTLPVALSDRDDRHVVEPRTSPFGPLASCIICSTSELSSLGGRLP